MKKILLTVFAVCVLNVLPSQAVEIGKSIGVSLSMNDVGTKVTDDIDNNGTITTTKNIEDTFGIASLGNSTSTTAPIT